MELPVPQGVLQQVCIYGPCRSKPQSVKSDAVSHFSPDASEADRGNNQTRARSSLL